MEVPLLTDLYKAFDCISNDLFISKQKAFGFQTDAWNLVFNYLSNSKKIAKINETFSSWKDIEYGVWQGSFLGPPLLNIHLCDLFYFLVMRMTIPDIQLRKQGVCY